MPNLKSKALVYGACAAIVASIVLGGQQLASNSNTLRKQRAEDRKLCHYNRVQNQILIGQLRGALVRLNASVDKSSPVWKQQHQVLTWGITELTNLKC